MAKDLARGFESYENERLTMALAPTVLHATGFQAIQMTRPGGMKIAQATRVDGTPVVFWVKQAWSTTSVYSAIQFGMLPPNPPPKTLPDAAFVRFVADRIDAAKRRGATHALLVHVFDEKIQHYVALDIDDLVRAYVLQIALAPARARNTKTPTLYFGDARPGADAAFIRAATDLDIRLEDLSGMSEEAEAELASPGSRKVTAEIERRFQQEIFRVRVGERCGWRCVITGVTITDVLDAAHLPGRNWRFHNEATDGILLRVDLHRLLDRQLAKIENGRFLIKKSARVGEYATYHRRPVAP